MKTYLLQKIASALLVAQLGACIIVTDPEPARVVVTQAPPHRDDVVVVRPTTPGPNYIWIEGYWYWSSSQWTWIEGHWEVSRVGYYWVTPHYETRGSQHYYTSGGWTKDPGYKGGKGSNSPQGYKTSTPKCPQGYVWSEGSCKYNAKQNYK